MKKKIQDKVNDNSKKVNEEDVKKTLENEHRIKEKIKSVPSQFKKLIAQVKLFLELVKDYANGSYRELPWGTLSVVIASIAYFLAPVDIIPDILPMVGFSDDALFFTFAIKFIQEDLKHYCTWKGKELNDYF